MIATKLTLRQVPLVLGIIPFITGLLLSDLLYIPLIFSITIIIVILGLLLFSPKELLHWRYRSTLIVVALFTCGIAHTGYQQLCEDGSTINPAVTSLSQNYDAEVFKVTTTEKYTNINVILKRIQSKHGTFSLAHNKCIVKIKDPLYAETLLPGDLLTVSTRLKPVLKDESQEGFDYGLFLQRQGINYIGYAKPIDISKSLTQRYSFWKYIRYDLRSCALNIIDEKLSNKNSAAIVKALLLGYKEDLSEEQRSSFIDSGTMHVLAVSGLHVGIVAFILFGLGRLLLYNQSKFSLSNISFVIIGLIFFAELSGGAPPVWRAVIMTSIYLGGRASGLYSHSLNMVALAAFVLLINDYQSIFNVSFQLSFAAVIGIILIYPILEKLYMPKGRIGRYCLGIVYMGIAAQVSLVPLSFYYFNQVSLLSPLTSIASISAAFVLIIGGFAMILISFFSNALSSLLSSFLESTVQLLERITSVMSEFKVAILDNIYFEGLESTVLACAIMLMAISYHSKSKRVMQLGFSLLFIQSIYHNATLLNHTNCIDIVYEQDSYTIKEIYIGRTAYITNIEDFESYETKHRRRQHKIKKVKLLDTNALRNHTDSKSNSYD